MIIRVTDDAVGGRLSDWVSLGVLTASMAAEVVDEVVTATGRQAKRSDGKLPPRMVVYYAMALALFADDDEQVAARPYESRASWGCWERAWTVPTSGGRPPRHGLTQNLDV